MLAAYNLTQKQSIYAFFHDNICFNNVNWIFFEIFNTYCQNFLAHYVAHWVKQWTYMLMLSGIMGSSPTAVFRYSFCVCQF